MIVLDAASRGWTAIYVGKTTHIRRRHRTHLNSWFTNPHDGYWIPLDATAFLDDPVKVFNSNAVAKGLPDRASTMRRVRERCKFVYATPVLADRGPNLENLEYVLQEGVKKHAGINEPGHIGDAGRHSPSLTDLIISNRFAEPALATSLPKVIEFTAIRLRLA